jgi:hypothetical protein
VEKQSAAEAERDALREKTRLARLAKEERAKKAKFDHLSSLKDLTLPEFADMRKRKLYDLPRNSNDDTDQRDPKGVWPNLSRRSITAGR